MNAPDSPLTLVFDGSLAASKEEAEHLKSKDKDGRLNLVDISAANVNPSDFGCTADEVRRSIRVRDASGKMLSGAAALEAAHEAVGLGSYFRFTRLPGMASGDTAFSR